MTRSLGAMEAIHGFRIKCVLGLFLFVVFTALQGLNGQTLINDWHDLDKVRHNLNGQYRLTQDLDKDTKGYQQVAGPQANGGKGFDPIDSTYVSNGIQYHLPFTGSFKGNGHTIEDLHVNRPNADYTALFGYILGATVQKLGVKDVQIEGLDHVAGLVGQIGNANAYVSFSNVKQCFTTGSIITNDSLGGGLIGEIAENTTDVYRCYSHVSVTGGDKLGGLIGSMPTGRHGLFQVYHPYIFRAYATGNVSGNQNVGGFTGYIKPGFPSSSFSVGQLFGQCFWDIQLTGQNGNGVSNLTISITDLTGLSSNPLKQLSTYTGASWRIATASNFQSNTDYWQILPTITYPYLRWESAIFRTANGGPSKWFNLNQWEVFNNRDAWLPSNRIPGNGQLKSSVIIRHDLKIRSSKKVTISGELALRSGVIDNKGTLTLSTNANVKGGNTTSYVDGPLKRKGEGTKYFPVGDSNKFAPVKLNIRAYGGFWRNPYGTVTYQKKAYQPNQIKTSSPIEAISQQEHWDLTVNDGRGDITLFWKDAAFSKIQNTRFLRLARWNGNSWELSGRDTLASQGNQGRIRVNNIRNFGRFTFGSTNANLAPLPVELLYFRAKALSKAVSLEWKTAAETNNSHFLVQRRTKNQPWQQIDSLPGHGTSLEPHEYTTTDRHPAAGYNYYRLKQVDHDGSHKFHGVKAVKIERNRQPSLQVRMLGNPVRGSQLTLRINAAEAQRAYFKLRSIQGTIQYMDSRKLQAGEASYHISMNHLPHGTYLLEVKSNNHQVTRKVVY